MAEVTLFHNPACSNSRGALALLRERGIELTIVDYLKAPLSRDTLRQLLAEMRMAPRALLRDKEAAYAELGLADPGLTDDQLLDALVAHPVLMQRPIVRTPRGTRVCRPPETVLGLLD